MTRQEFLETLRKTLNRELEPGEVEENIRFYDEYIRDQVARGQEEAQVIAQLGDPRLIAKTILQVDEQKESAPRTSYYDAGQTVYTEDTEGNRYYSQEAEGAYYGEEPGNGRRNMKLHSFQLKGWMVVVVLIVICVVLFTLLGAAAVILWRLLPILLVIWGIMWIYRRFFK